MSTQHQSMRIFQMLSNVRSFIILQWREVLTSFSNDNNANFSNEIKYNEEFRDVYFLQYAKKV